MKKTMKKLMAAALSTALLTSALPMTMASAANTIENNQSYSQNFDALTDATQLGFVDRGNNGGTYELKETAGKGNVMALKGITTMQNDSFNLTSGTYKLSFEVKPKAGTNTTVILIDGETSDTRNNPYFLCNFRDGDHHKLYAGNTNSTELKANFTTGIWYTVESIIDIDNGTAQTTISDNNGTKYRTPIHKFNTYNPNTQFNKLNGLRFATADSTGTDEVIEIDNIVLEPTAVVFEENFDGFADAAALGSSAGWSYVNGSVVNEDGRGKIYVPEQPANVVYTLATPISSGTYKFSYDVKPTKKSQLGAYLIDSNQNKAYLTAVVKNYDGRTDRTGVYAGGGAALFPTVNLEQWYHVESILDFTNKTAETVITDNNGNQYTQPEHKFNGIDTGVEFSELKQIKLFNYAYNLNEPDTGKTGAFDNIKMEKYTAPIRPVTVDESDITIKSGENVQSDWTAVAAESNTIVIDFGRAMNESTLNATNIRIHNRTANVDVAYTAAYANNKYTITLTDALTTGKLYDIIIGTGVKAEDTGAVESEIKHSFKVFAQAVIEPGVILNETFDDLASISELNSKGWSGANGSVANEAGRGQVFVPEQPANVFYTLSTPISSGKYKFSYDVKPTKKSQLGAYLIDSNQNKAYLQAAVKNYDGRADRTGVYAGVDGGGKALFATVNLEQWYHVESILDFTNKTAKTVITDNNGNQYTQPEHKFNGLNTSVEFSELKQIKLFNFAYNLNEPDTGKTGAFDNIRLEELKFEVSKSNATIKDANGSIQSDWTKVNPFSKTVEIAFDDDMDESTLKSDNIYITDNNGNKIITTGVAGDNKFTINIEQLLNVNATYKIVVTTDVKTSKNEALAANAEIEFTTTTAIKDNTSTVKKVHFTDNFDGYADFAALGNKWGSLTDASGNIASLQEVDGRGKVFAVRPTLNSEPNIGEKLIGGCYKVTASIKPRSSGQTGFTLSASQNNNTNAIPYRVVNFYNGNMIDGSGKTIGEGVDCDKWYDIELLIDLDKYTAQLTVTDENGTAYTGKAHNIDANNSNLKETQSSLDNYGLATIQRMRLYVYGDVDGNLSLFDNIKIEDYYPTPEIDETNSFTFTTINGVESKAVVDVSPLVNKITVDFGTKLKSSTVTADNIKLTLSNNTVVETVVEYGGGNEVVIHVADGVLKGETGYKVVIGAGLQNLDGVAIAESSVGSYGFETGKDRVSGTLTGVKRGGEAIETLAQLKSKVGKITINLDCVNSKVGTDGLDIYLIVAYYKNNEMLDAKYVKENVPGNIHTTTRNITIDASDELENADMVKVMAWDGFDAMHPISASIELD